MLWNLSIALTVLRAVFVYRVTPDLSALVSPEEVAYIISQDQLVGRSQMRQHMLTAQTHIQRRMSLIRLVTVAKASSSTSPG
jgi:hypothetical protein